MDPQPPLWGSVLSVWCGSWRGRDSATHYGSGREDNLKAQDRQTGFWGNLWIRLPGWGPQSRAKVIQLTHTAPEMEQTLGEREEPE